MQARSNRSEWTVAQSATFAARRDFELLQLLSTDRRALAAARRLGGRFTSGRTVTEDAEASLPGRRRKRTSTSTKATDSSAKAASNRQQRTPSKPNSAERRSTKRLKKYLADEGWLKKKEQMKPKDERRTDERPTAGPTAADPKLPHAADPGGTAAEQPSPHSSEPPEEEADEDEIMASDDDAPRREPTPPSRRRQSSLVRIPASKRRGGKRGKSKRARPGR